jgi:AsmA-like C-terminal region/AsmA family
MKKLVLAVGALVMLAVAALAGLGLYLASKLNSPELEKAILDQARATLGTELEVKEMDISLLSGVTLEGISVANPAPFPGQLVTADAFVLRYRLLPLLRGRVEVERLALEKPALALAMDAKGGFNYEKLGGAASKGAPTAPATGGGEPATPAAAPPLRIVMKSLSVEDGSIRMTDHTQASLMAVEDIDFESAFEVADGAAQGTGAVSIGKANFADVLLVSAVKAPLTMSKERVALAPIRGQVAGGTVSGELTVELAGGFRFTTDVALEGAQVKTLLEQAGSAPAVSGTLSGKAHFEGKGGLPTMRGKGSAEVASCRAENSKVLALLSSALQVPELANPDFSSCRLEFTQAGSRLTTPVVELKGDAIRLSGHGSLNLDTSGLDYQMALGLAPKLLAKITRPELRAGFQDQCDGFSTIAFRLYGTTLEPRTDLLSRVGKAAATGVAKDQVNKLLKKKIF